jgi:hypothetical protein
MIQQELRQLSTTTRDLRKFGLMVGGVFLLISGWLLWRHKPLWPYFLTPGALLVVLGLAVPRALKGVYLAWMSLAFTLGLVVSTLILTLFFFLAVTPLGLMGRIFGKDFLSEKLNPRAKSYWLPRDRSAPRQPADYEKQY